MKLLPHIWAHEEAEVKMFRDSAVLLFTLFSQSKSPSPLMVSHSLRVSLSFSVNSLEMLSALGGSPGQFQAREGAMRWL